MDEGPCVPCTSGDNWLGDRRLYSRAACAPAVPSRFENLSQRKRSVTLLARNIKRHPVFPHIEF